LCSKEWATDERAAVSVMPFDDWLFALEGCVRTYLLHTLGHEVFEKKPGNLLGITPLNKSQSHIY